MINGHALQEQTPPAGVLRLTIRERHLVYGVMGQDGAYLLRFDAPAIYYFDRHLAEFEAAVSTFELL